MPEGHTWDALVVNRSGRGDGCPSCAQSGYDPNKDGWLYFLSHPNWEMLQIGITNVPDDRLGSHKRLGWEVLGTAWANGWPPRSAVGDRNPANVES